MLYNGITGGIKAGATELAATDVLHMSTWDVDMSTDIKEISSFGKEYKEKLPGIKDWSASASGAADFETASGQKTLLDAWNAGQIVFATFLLTETTFFKGTALIESIKISQDVEGNATIDISLTGTDGVVLTIPA